MLGTCQRPAKTTFYEGSKAVQGPIIFNQWATSISVLYSMKYVYYLPIFGGERSLCTPMEWGRPDQDEIIQKLYFDFSEK